VFEADIDRAVNLLEKVGFTGIDENGIRFRPTEAGVEQLKFRLLTNLESGLRRHAQELIAQQLEDVGILVEIHVLPWDEFVLSLKEKDFDMVLTSFDVGRFQDLSFNVQLGADEIPFSLYSSDELNNLLNEAKRAYDQETLRKIYGNVQGYINNMLPIISLYFRTASVFFDERIKGVETPLTEDIYNGIEKWYFDNLAR
jgi:ABC-type transport system substrate-binding protein